MAESNDKNSGGQSAEILREILAEMKKLREEMQQALATLPTEIAEAIVAAADRT